MHIILKFRVWLEYQLMQALIFEHGGLTDVKQQVKDPFTNNNELNSVPLLFQIVSAYPCLVIKLCTLICYSVDESAFNCFALHCHNSGTHENDPCDVQLWRT